MSIFKRQSISHLSLSPNLLLGITLFFPLKLFGAEQAALQIQQSVPQAEQIAPQPATTIPQPEKSEYFNSMEVRRDYLSGKITSFASYVDRFFGGDRHYQESNQSVFKLVLTRVDGYGGNKKFELAARMSLRLPITEGKLRLLLETDPEKNITTEPIKGQPVLPVLNNSVVVPRSYAAAVRYEMKEESRWYYNTDVGVKFRGITSSPNPFVRARGSYSAPLREWRLKITETLFWFNTIGAGETTQFDLERIISTPFLFRASSNATWLNDKQNFDLRQDLSVYHTLSDRTALLYQLSVIGVSNPQLQVRDYVALIFYRHRLHQQWLFFEISPQLHFPLSENYKPSPALSMRLEVIFDDSR